MGRAKMERWGPGAANSGRKERANVRESAERRKARVLCAIKKWVGQGGKATLATAPDADILREIICLLTQRVRAGRATFLIKVKSHRGEPINERADTLAEEGWEISDDDKR
jgi:ribonuclease HI